jgi:hypothetical protein
MNNDFENPFADYGDIVYGDRFIGRKDDLRVIESRIIRPKEAGNLAIIGEPRIGKSSLIYKSIMDRKTELNCKKLLPIWINLCIYENKEHFFTSLVTHCSDELKRLNISDEITLRLAQDVIEDRQPQSEKYYLILRFFEKVKQTGYHVLFILDEFDCARKLFRGDISGFQKLRELSYRPEWRVTFITTSRRSIREIETQTQAISTFDGIFYKHYLAMFKDYDIDEYFKRLSSIKLSINSEQRDKILFYCGGHPYLLEVLGYEIVEMFREKRIIDVNESASCSEQSLVDYYDHLIKLLQEDGSFNKLLQILFGPVIDIKQTDVDKFLKYGIIKTNIQGIYTGFSEHFQIFLYMIQRDVDLWPLWSKTEKLLRDTIEKAMLDQYGENWITKIEKSHNKLKPIFDNCRNAQMKEEKSFGSRASLNLIDFTYPGDLFAIIFAEWNIFRSIFRNDTNYWDLRKKLIAKIRNPLAHNRDAILSEYERQIAEGYCNEILSLLQTERR